MIEKLLVFLDFKGGGNMEGYCLKCKHKREMLKTHKHKIKGRNFVKGVCKKCGTNMSKVVK